MERVKGFEPSASTLATSHSTTELHPQGSPAPKALTSAQASSGSPFGTESVRRMHPSF